jgi:hypothetical protein
VQAIRRKVALGTVAVGLVGLGLGAQPLADRFTHAQIAAPTTITGAALVTTAAPPVEPEPPLNTEPFGPPPPPPLTTKPSSPVNAPPAWKPALPLKGPSADALFEERK